MSNNYDDVCSICGQAVNADTMYYCCPECQRKHKKQKDQAGHGTMEETFISGSENLKEEAIRSTAEVKPPQG